ncbi:MAG: MBL fold metallo-hydrolase [Candidatus Omnitrophica bacterium]|nr:MBL fold metallo-hydrolase [Candidatus Omnitrophota bacterium]
MIENIRWLGHASLLLMVGEKQVYVDPWKLKNPRPASLVLITHEHFDHCSGEDVEKIATGETPVIGPESALKKIKVGHLIPLKPREKYDFGWLLVEGIPAYNLKKEFHPQSRGDLGYLLIWSGKSIYIAGDTDFIPEMKDIHPEIAIVPVGGTYTMDAAEAAEAVKAMVPKIAIPIHFGDIVGSRRSAEEFQRLVKEAEVRII